MKIVLATVCTIFIFISLFAQHEIDNRVIGFKYILKFNQNKPNVTVTNKNLYNPTNTNYKGIMGTPYANSMCDTLGNLLFYYDGATLYQANGQIMDGGGLHPYNFSNHYISSLIVPIEESNRRYYYLFETLPHEENFDYTLNQPKEYTPSCYYPNECAKFWDLCILKYSIIDIQGNNGKGKIIKKNIFIADSVAPTLSGVKHNNNIDTWVSVLKYHTNKILNYKVNSCNVSTPIISSIPDFEYKNKPLYVSYTASYGLGFQFVYSTKGDYIAFPGTKISNDTSDFLFITTFDNQTGLFDFNALQTILVTSGLNLNLFSYDSEYLYYHDTFWIGNPVWTYQYNLSTHTSIPFYYNLVKNRSTGVDYGKNNDILFFKYKVLPTNVNLNASYLEQLNNINQPFVPTNLIDSLQQPAFYQPEYVSSFSYISHNNYIYNFYNPDYKKPNAFPVAIPISNTVKSPSCFNKPVTLKGHSTIPADSLFWVVKKSTDNTWQRYNRDTIHLALTTGTYTASLVSYKYCLADSSTQEFVLEDYPLVHLADDTLYTCESKPIELPINTTYTYNWYNAYGTITSKTINQTGQYDMVVKNSCGAAKDSLFVQNSILKVMNLVTPNNDTKNDCLFTVSNNPNESIQLSIYNAWGSRVFYDAAYSNNWCPQNDLTDGVYYYEAVYTNNCATKGWVQVMH